LPEKENVMRPFANSTMYGLVAVPFEPEREVDTLGPKNHLMWADAGSTKQTRSVARHVFIAVLLLAVSFAAHVTSQSAPAEALPSNVVLY
jgi:hypothetical protein